MGLRTRTRKRRCTGWRRKAAARIMEPWRALQRWLHLGGCADLANMAGSGCHVQIGGLKAAGLSLAGS